MRTSASGIAARPIGTLSQKIQCQSMPSATVPPITGPATTASPVMPSRIPMADPRRSAEKAALTSASESVITSAPPTPWTARAAISQPASGASAHATEASENKARPAVNIRRRPNLSPSAAAGSSNTARLRL